MTHFAHSKWSDFVRQTVSLRMARIPLVRVNMRGFFHNSTQVRPPPTWRRPFSACRHLPFPWRFSTNWACGKWSDWNRSIFFSISWTEIILENNEKARNPCRNFVRQIFLSHHHDQWHVWRVWLKYGICRANGKAGGAFAEKNRKKMRKSPFLHETVAFWDLWSC